MPGMLLGRCRMHNRAFLIVGDRATFIANDTNDFRYRAAAHYVPVGV